MPIITADGKKAYGRHEEVPVPRKPIKPRTEEPTPKPTPQQQQQQQQTSTSNATTRSKQQQTQQQNKTATSSPPSSTSSGISWSVVMEVISLLFVVILLSWGFVIRQDGAISFAGSVMGDYEAEIYTTQLTSSYVTSSSVPTLIPTPPQNTDGSDGIDNTVDEAWAFGPCGDIRNQVMDAANVTAKYKIQAKKIVINTNTDSQVDDEYTTVEPTQSVTFMVKPTNVAIQTASTLPLLHTLSLGMCKGQIKTVEFTEALYQKAVQATTQNDASHPFRPTQSDFLLTLFPTFSTGSRSAKTTTITFPIEFSLEVVDVVTKDARKTKILEEEKIKFQNGDLSAFVRAIIGSIHPIVALIVYVALRTGGAFYKRWKIRAHRQKAIEASRINAAANAKPSTKDATTASVVTEKFTKAQVEEIIDEVEAVDDDGKKSD